MFSVALAFRFQECHRILPFSRLQRPSQNRACRFPAHGSSARLPQRHRSIHPVPYAWTPQRVMGQTGEHPVGLLTGPLCYQSKCPCGLVHLRVWASRLVLCSTGRRPLRVGPACAVPRRALPRLPLYYEPVRLPHLHGPALPRRLVGADKRCGSPKFRCNPLDGPLRPATPAGRDRLA